MITIIDYGMANLESVRKAFEIVGADTRIITNPEDLPHASHVVLPGVGAFGNAMKNIRDRGIDEPHQLFGGQSWLIIQHEQCTRLDETDF